MVCTILFGPYRATVSRAPRGQLSTDISRASPPPIVLSTEQTSSLRDIQDSPGAQSLDTYRTVCYQNWSPERGQFTGRSASVFCACALISGHRGGRPHSGSRKIARRKSPIGQHPRGLAGEARRRWVERVTTRLSVGRWLGAVCSHIRDVPSISARRHLLNSSIEYPSRTHLVGHPTLIL